jgi:hypothetical protein
MAFSRWKLLWTGALVALALLVGRVCPPTAATSVGPTQTPTTQPPTQLPSEPPARHAAAQKHLADWNARMKKAKEDKKAAKRKENAAAAAKKKAAAGRRASDGASVGADGSASRAATARPTASVAHADAHARMCGDPNHPHVPNTCDDAARVKAVKTACEMVRAPNHTCICCHGLYPVKPYRVGSSDPLPDEDPVATRMCNNIKTFCKPYVKGGHTPPPAARAFFTETTQILTRFYGAFVSPWGVDIPESVRREHQRRRNENAARGASPRTTVYKDDAVAGDPDPSFPAASSSPGLGETLGTSTGPWSWHNAYSASPAADWFWDDASTRSLGELDHVLAAEFDRAFAEQGTPTVAHAAQDASVPGAGRPATPELDAADGEDANSAAWLSPCNDADDAPLTDDQIALDADDAPLTDDQIALDADDAPLTEDQIALDAFLADVPFPVTIYVCDRCAADLSSPNCSNRPPLSISNGFWFAPAPVLDSLPSHAYALFSGLTVVQTSITLAVRRGPNPTMVGYTRVLQGLDGGVFHEAFDTVRDLGVSRLLLVRASRDITDDMVNERFALNVDELMRAHEFLLAQSPAYVETNRLAPLGSDPQAARERIQRGVDELLHAPEVRVADQNLDSSNPLNAEGISTASIHSQDPRIVRVGVRNQNLGYLIFHRGSRFKRWNEVKHAFGRAVPSTFWACELIWSRCPRVGLDDVIRHFMHLPHPRNTNWPVVLGVIHAYVSWHRASAALSFRYKLTADQLRDVSRVDLASIQRAVEDHVRRPGRAIRTPLGRNAVTNLLTVSERAMAHVTATRNAPSGAASSWGTTTPSARRWPSSRSTSRRARTVISTSGSRSTSTTAAPRTTCASRDRPSRTSSSRWTSTRSSTPCTLSACSTP